MLLVKALSCDLVFLEPHRPKCVLENHRLQTHQHTHAVSGGGYAMVGTVISADMDLIAQMQPNYKARFVAVDMAQALAARLDKRQRLQRLRAALAP